MHIINKNHVQNKPFEALNPEGEGKQKKMGRTESVFKTCSIYWNHPFSAYAKFSEKVTFLTTLNLNVVFREILRTYYMDGTYIRHTKPGLEKLY